jgi:hypothetical protein
MGHIKRFIGSVTEDTPISLGVLAIILGAVVWLTELKLDSTANANTISYIQSKLEQMEQKNDQRYQDTQGRLIRIEDAIKKDLNGSDQ